MKLLLIAFTLLLAQITDGRAQPAETPKTFMQAVYRHYTVGDPSFTPLFQSAPSFFSDSLLALIRRDQNVAPGDSGRLDFDPICDCQDADGMRVDSLKILDQENRSAQVQAELDFSGKPFAVKFKLVKQSDGWRIDDVDDPDMPSLRQFLVGSRN